MTIAVLCKWCPDPADLEVRGDGSVSLERAKWSISEYDRVALEVAMSLASANDPVVALAAGGAALDTSMARKSILSRGPDALYLIVEESLADADARQTAIALVEAVKRIGNVDLVVCGAGSADLYAQQVGIQVGERLGWPCLNEVLSVRRDDGAWRVERRVDAELDVVGVPSPAVVAVTADAALPRVPGMREILSGGKKPATKWTLAELGISAPLERSSVVLSTVARRSTTRGHVLLEGSAAEAAGLLVGALRQEGLV